MTCDQMGGPKSIHLWHYNLFASQPDDYARSNPIDSLLCILSILLTKTEVFYLLNINPSKHFHEIFLVFCKIVPVSGVESMCVNSTWVR